MWQTGNTFPTWRNYVMRVVLISALLFVAACTAPGRSSSTPSALSPEGGLAGPMTQGDGGSGNGM
jgi:hypothetical protein